MRKLSGVCLVTRDVLRLSAFYRDLLEVDREGDHHHAELLTQGGALAIFSEQGMEQMAPGSMQGAGHGGFTLSFEVQDVDHEYERACKMGVPVLKAPASYPWGTRSVWLRDPDGNIINFYAFVKGKEE